MFCLTFEILLFVDFYHRPHNYLQVFQQFNIKSKLWSKIIKPIVSIYLLGASCTMKSLENNSYPVKLYFRGSSRFVAKLNQHIIVFTGPG